MNNKTLAHNALYRAATVSVIIPALNESKNLPFVLPHIPGWIHEVILIPGNSKDQTVAVAKSLWPEVRIVDQDGPGKGSALRSGIAAATGDIIVMLDADGSTDPGEIPLFLGALLAGADFVKGSRYTQGGGSADLSIIRNIGNRGLTALVSLLFDCRYTDLCYGYCAFWRKFAPQLDLKSTGFEIETEMNLRALTVGLKIMEVASYESSRIHGESNLQPIRDGLRVLRTILQERLRTWAGTFKSPVGSTQSRNTQESM